MTLHLLRGRWWRIVFPPSGMLRNDQKGCLPESVCGLLAALTYLKWYTRLHMVGLVNKGPRGLTDTVPRVEVLP